MRVYEKARTFLHLLWPAVLLLAAAPAAAAGDEGEAAPIRLGSYELGRGLPLGDSGFTLGGYATARYADERDRDARLSADHLSLMLWWEGSGRLKFFSEADLEQAIATRRRGAEEERFLALERFYFDYALSDSANVRLGKYLTPIGRWNQIHADPLVWTTSRPLVTQAVFPQSATGAMLQGSLPFGARDMDYAVFLSLGSELRRKPAEDPFSDARGVHLNLPLGDKLQLGLSMAEFEQEAAPGERKKLAGLDFLWTARGWEVSGEGVYRQSSDGAAQTAKGGFVQLVAPLGGRLHAVGRVESFRYPGTARDARSWVMGLNYRVTRALSLKAEVVGGSHLQEGTPEGFLASVSVLF